MTDQSPAIEELILFAEHLCLSLGEKQLLRGLLARGWPIFLDFDTIRGAIEYILLRGPSVEHEIETVYNDLYEIADKLSPSKQKVMYRSPTYTKWVDLGTTTSLNDALDWNIEPPKLR